MRSKKTLPSNIRDAKYANQKNANPQLIILGEGISMLKKGSGSNSRESK